MDPDNFRGAIVNLRGDTKEITKHLEGTQRKVIPAAVSTSLNKTGAKLNTVVKRDLAKELGVPQKAFKNQIKLFRATRRRWKAKEWIGTKKTIKVSKILHSSALDKYYAKGLIEKPAGEIFTVTLNNGHRGQFYRKGEGRLPIQEIVLNISSVALKVLTSAADRANISREFRRLLSHELQRRIDLLRVK